MYTFLQGSGHLLVLMAVSLVALTIPTAGYPHKPATMTTTAGMS